MNCASSERATNFLEKTFLTLNDLVSAANSSKECIPNHFLTNFKFLSNFSIGQTFTSYDQLCFPNLLKWTVPPLEERPVSQRKVSLLETIWYRLEKLPQCTPQTIFWQIFSFWSNLVQVKILLFLRISSNDLYLLWKSNQSLK